MASEQQKKRKESEFNLINTCFRFVIGEFQVTSRPISPIDYELPDAHDDEQNESDSKDDSSIARIVIIATAVLGVLLIIVLCAILCRLNFHYSTCFSYLNFDMEDEI